MPLTAAVSSVATHVGDPCDIFVAQQGFTDVDVARVESAAGQLSVHWIDVKESAVAGALLPSHLPPAALYRLLLPDLLPTRIDRYVHLDTDTLVLGGLEALFEIDLLESSAGAVRDPSIAFCGSSTGPPFLDLGLEPTAAYFNSGVLVVDPARWRELEVGKRALEILTRHRLPYGDQCALNAVLVGSWRNLHPKWNLQPAHSSTRGYFESAECAGQIQEAVENPVIRQFVDAKPWQENGEDVLGSDSWFECLDRTDYAGWRPRKRRRFRPKIPVPTRQLRWARDRAVDILSPAADRIGVDLRVKNAIDWPEGLGIEAVKELIERTDGRVAAGPFAGMRLPAQQSWGEEFDFASRILGVYEQELHPAIESIIDASPPVVVNLGCADGYYAVGLARRIPGARVIGVDISPASREPFIEAATLNRVEDRTRWFPSLKDAASEITTDGSAWIVDIEGSEIEELDLTAHPSLASATLIVECHDMVKANTTGTLARRFAPTHSIETLFQSGRDPNQIPLLARMVESDRWLAVSEGRPIVMNWLVLRPLEGIEIFA